MTENEYVDVTNLAKLRAAKVITNDVLPMCPEDEADLKIALLALRRVEARIQERVESWRMT